MNRIRRPRLADWQKWSWEDYLTYFLSIAAAKARARKTEQSILEYVSPSDLPLFCAPIRERLTAMFSSASPQVSIQMPTRNDHCELLPTLVSLTLLDIEPGRAEVVVADNGSSDCTAAIIQACGVKYAYAPEPGMGRARRAAYDAMAPSAEFVWLTDGDIRTLPPLRKPCELYRRSSILRTNLNCMESRPDVVGLSTGIVYEYVHPVFWTFRAAAVILGKAPRVHCWTGPNQFVRRSTLDAIGGINPNVPYRAREDHQRMYELARYAKTIKANMLNAANDAWLFDPVYHSGRRRGTARDVLAAALRGRHTVRGPRDRYGFPVHPLDRGIPHQSETFR